MNSPFIFILIVQTEFSLQSSKFIIGGLVAGTTPMTPPVQILFLPCRPLDDRWQSFIWTITLTNDFGIIKMSCRNCLIFFEEIWEIVIANIINCPLVNQLPT